MTLATQDDLEKLLQVDFGANPDASVAQYLTQADAAIANYCGQPLTYDASVVDTFEGRGDSPTHVLERGFVSAVASVVEDGDTLTVTDEYLWYTDGRLRRVSGAFDWYWSKYANGVVVTYSAGYGAGAASPYDVVPDDVVLVAAGYAASLFKQGAHWAAHGVEGPVKSVALDGSDTITYDTAQANKTDQTTVPSLSPGQMMLLAPYMRRAL